MTPTEHGEARFRTIVADPPWPYGKFNNFQGPNRWGRQDRKASKLDYPTMDLDAICELPVDGLAEDDAHLYLWTTTRFLEAAFTVVRAWGFQYSTTLTWVKRPMGRGMGGAFHPSTEFVLFATRGSLVLLGRHPQSHFEAKRPYDNQGKPLHSAKPDYFLDIVEAVSPGPYVELFARRARFGWSYWGDESLQTVELVS